MLLIKNGRVLNPATKTDAAMDVLLDGDRIKEVGAPGKTSAGNGQSQNGLEVFDASGLIVAPGFIDIHTHLFAPDFGKLGLWGIDELLTYHYLEAELFRSSSISPERYWKLSKREQADEIVPRARRSDMLCLARAWSAALR